MKRTVVAFVIIGILGSVWHFFYDWTGENYFVGLFAPVNESTWEHLKLLFWPVLLYFGIEHFFFSDKRHSNFLPALALGIFSGMLAIVSSFYTYSGILGYTVDFINILTYFIGLAVLLTVKTLVTKNRIFTSKTAKIISAVLLLTFAVFSFIWSHNPPSLGIFTPPVNQ